MVRSLFITTLLLLMVVAACKGPEPTPTPARFGTEVPDVSILPVVIPYLGEQPIETRLAIPPTTPALTPTPVPTAFPTRTRPVPAATPVPVSTVSLTPTPSAIAGATPRPTPTPLELPVATPVPGITPTPTLVATPATTTPSIPIAVTKTPQVPTVTEAQATPTVPGTITPTATAAPTPTIEATPTLSPTPTAIATATPTPTPPLIGPPPISIPTPTPLPPVLPEWTLELEIVPTPGNVAGLGNLSLGADQRCPGTIGCRGSLPPAVVPFDFQVYLCHPPDPTQENCNGLAPDELLSHSLLAPAEIQTWVVEVTRTDQVNEITFTWHASSLPDLDTFRLRIVDSRGFLDMRNLPSDPNTLRSYDVFKFFPDHNTQRFLICQVTGAAPDIPCPDEWP